MRKAMIFLMIQADVLKEQVLQKIHQLYLFTMTLIMIKCCLLSLSQMFIMSTFWFAFYVFFSLDYSETLTTLQQFCRN
jgi:hypothetical protein